MGRYQVHERARWSKSDTSSEIPTSWLSSAEAQIWVFGGIAGWERLPRSTDLEQTSQALIQHSDGVKKICGACGSVGHFMGVQIRGERFAQLSGAADALLREQGAHSGGIPLVGLALLQFLKSPGGLAYIIDGVAKLTKDARVHPTRPDGVFQFLQVVDRPLQPKRHAPKSFAGSKKLDGHSQHVALFGGTQGYHSRSGYLG